MFPVVNSYLNSLIWIWIFIFLAALIVLSQYIILFFVKPKTLGIGKMSSTMHLSLLNWVIGLIQGILYAIVGFCIFQMFYGEEYYTNILSIIATISFSVEIFILGLLTLKLVNWCKLNKSKILWMFILSSSSLAITGILMNLQINILFENSLSRVSDDMPGISPALAGNSLIEFLQRSYFIFALVSFTLMWITTAFFYITIPKRLEIENIG